MPKIQSKISFGSENLEYLINEIIQEKIKEVTYKIKNRDIMCCNQNKGYESANDLQEKVDEIK